MSHLSEQFDHEVRRHVYDVTVSRGYPPSLAESAMVLGVPDEQVRASFQRLAAERVLVLQRDTDEILMGCPHRVSS
jgi:predicted ArsR family transcriptional regulator